MTAPDKNTGLENWLAQATRGLGELAKDRIRDEIVAHYDATVQSALEDGASELDAREKALNALGDPLDANNRFRKANLNHREEAHIAKLMASVIRYRVSVLRPIALGLSPVVCGAILVFLVVFLPSALLIGAPPAYLHGTYYLANLYWRKSKMNGRHRRVFHISFGYVWSATAFFVGFFFWLWIRSFGPPTGLPALIAGSIALFGAAVMILGHRRIARKLSDDEIVRIVERIEQDSKWAT